MDQITIRLKDSYGNIDALIGELLGSEIVLHKDILYYMNSPDSYYRYECPLLNVGWSHHEFYDTIWVTVLGMEVSLDKMGSDIDTMFDKMLKKLNKFCRDSGPIHNPIYQALVAMKYWTDKCSQISWKGFDFSFDHTNFYGRMITIKYGDEIIFSLLMILDWEPVIEKVLAEMCDGSSELLQYSFKRMKSARKI
jgi:hypothetical protein